MLAKLTLVGKDLDAYSLETVAMFRIATPSRPDTRSPATLRPCARLGLKLCITYG